MCRLKKVLFTSFAMMFLGVSFTAFAQKKEKKIPEKPDVTLHVPTMTLQEETIIVDLSKPVPQDPMMIPLANSLVEEQKNPKKVVIVPAPPPFPGKDPIPPKYPDKQE